MAKYLVIFLLFVLPLVVIPFSFSPFEIPKVFLAEIGVWLLIFLAIFKDGFFIKRFNQEQLFLALSLILISLFHLIFYTNTNFFGNIFRLQGVFLLWNLLLFSLISAQIYLDRIPGKLVLGVIIALLISSFLIGPNGTGRAIATLGEPNSLAAVAIFLWPFAFFGSKKPIQSAALLGSLVLVLLSGSRSGLVAFFIQIIFFMLAKNPKLSLKISLNITILLIVLSLSLPFIEGGGWFENRAEIWQTAFFAGSQNFILGGGFGNTENLLKEASLKLNNNIQYQIVDSSHNFFLDFWVQSGIAGVVLICLMVYLSFRKFVQHQKKQELVLMLGILTVMMFNPASVVTLVAFWWLIGQGFSSRQQP